METEKTGPAAETKRPILTLLANKTIERDGELRAMLGGEQYVVDTGADVTGHVEGIPSGETRLTQLATGALVALPVTEKHGVQGLETHAPLLAIKDLDKAEDAYPQWDLVEKPREVRPAQINWMKPVDIPAVMDKVIENSQISDKQRLREILCKGQYAAFKNDCGKLDASFTCNIVGTIPPRQPQHSVHPDCVKELSETINELCALGIIREIENPPTSTPVLGVRKSDNSWRLVHNLVELNLRSHFNARTMFNVARTSRTLPNKRLKSSLDLSNAFWSNPLARDAQPKTSFTWKGIDGITRSYCWQVLPMGLSSAPNICQSAMERVLQGLDVVCYVDDIYWTSDTEEEHLSVLEAVLLRLAKAGLKVNLKKCEIGQFKLKFLGFEITTEGKAVPKEYLDGIAASTVPGTLGELATFLGKGEYVSNHTPGYALCSAPLHKWKGRFLKKDCKEAFSMPPEMVEAWDKLKEAVLAAKPLEKREPEKDLEVYVWSGEAGGTLELRNEGSEKPCLFLSKSYSATEHKYNEEERALALLFPHLPALKTMSMGRKIIVRSPYPSLSLLTKETLVGARAMGCRWSKWSMMMHDPDIAFVQHGSRPPKVTTRKPKPKQPTTHTLFTDGSKRAEDGEYAKWAFILKRGNRVVKSRSGYMKGSAQAAEVSSILEGIIAANKAKCKALTIVTDSDYCFRGGNEELDIWDGRGYTNVKGQELAHGDLWRLIFQNSVSLYTEYVKVEAHTEDNTYTANGNREVDTLAQDRSDRFKMQHFTVVTPAEWQEAGGAIVVPEGEEWNLLTKVHSHLGHVGARRVKIFLDENNIRTKSPIKTVQKIRKACERCAAAGGFKKTPTVDQPIVCEEAGKHFSADIAGPLCERTKAVTGIFWYWQTTDPVGGRFGHYGPQMVSPLLGRCPTG